MLDRVARLMIPVAATGLPRTMPRSTDRNTEALPANEAAETLAIRVVGELAQRPELLRRFLDLAGLTIDDLRQRLHEPMLLGAILDFVLFDDRLTREIAAALDVPPAEFDMQRRRLPGASPEG